MDSRFSNSLRIRVPFDAMLKGKKLWKRWISFFIYILLCLHEKLFARIDCWIVILFLLIIEVVIVIILIVNIYRVVENKSKNKSRSSLLAGLFKIKREEEEEEGKSWDTKKEIFQKETLASCDYYITRERFHYRIFESLSHHFVYFRSFLHEWKRWNVDFARKEEDRKEALTFVSTTPMIY